MNDSVCDSFSFPFSGSIEIRKVEIDKGETKLLNCRERFHSINSMNMYWTFGDEEVRALDEEFLFSLPEERDVRLWETTVKFGTISDYRSFEVPLL